MTPSNILDFAEPTGTMTVLECLEFIARTRRQLDRFAAAIPHAGSTGIALETDAKLRTMLNDLEADMAPLISLT